MKVNFDLDSDPFQSQFLNGGAFLSLQARKAQNINSLESRKGSKKLTPPLNQVLSQEYHATFRTFCACSRQNQTIFKHRHFDRILRTFSVPLPCLAETCCGLMTSQMNNLLQRQPHVMMTTLRVMKLSFENQQEVPTAQQILGVLTYTTARD